MTTTRRPAAQYDLIVEITDDAFGAHVRKTMPAGVSGPHSDKMYFATLAELDAWVAGLGFTQHKAFGRTNPSGSHVIPLEVAP